jgi:hypothetical protein
MLRLIRSDGSVDFHRRQSRSLSGYSGDPPKFAPGTPDRANRCQPLIRHGSEPRRTIVFNAPETVRQAEFAQDRIPPGPSDSTVKPKFGVWIARKGLGQHGNGIQPSRQTSPVRRRSVVCRMSNCSARDATCRYPIWGDRVFQFLLDKIGFVEAVRQHMPIRWRSPNQIDPIATFKAFLISVLVGARRFPHASPLRGDRALHALLGLDAFLTADTIRNLFRRFGMGEVQRLFAPLAEWKMQRLPPRAQGYTLDLDSTVFERYGKQQGLLKLKDTTRANTNGPAIISVGR